MSKNLVIVESPAKAKTISRFLGKDYKVLASMGHVRDLPKSKMGIDTEKTFEAEYLISEDKKKVIASLKKELKAAEVLWIATDEDREGEAIGWHLLEALDVKKKKIETHRIVFHEITKEAILHSLETPRQIDKKLVDAQQARRILDRLVGYELSPLLWKKVKAGLSAGRVQSVAVRLIVEREREIKAFEPEEYWKIIGEFEKEKQVFEAQLAKIAGKKAVVSNEKEAKKVLSDVDKADYFVDKVTEKEIKRNPAPPFITSTLQQEASRKLGFSVKKTMMVAQQLYEGIDVGNGEQGLITYMRTDSVNLSQVALKKAKQVITKEYGAEYALETPRFYKGKKGAQEAHEAIRPVDLGLAPAMVAKHLNKDQIRLYELIWKRTLACQMKQAILNRVAADIVPEKSGKKLDYMFRATGQTIVFPGFMEVYLEGNDNEESESQDGEKILPKLVEGEKVDLKKMNSTQHFTKPPARYTEASLVKKLEEEGIGRPSTYAPVISTVQQRGYVVKDGRQLAPEDVAYIVIDLLIEHFPTIVDVGFTRDMEQMLDNIADGEEDHVKFLKEFYKPFHKDVDEKTESIKREDVMKERVLGKDKNTGLEIIARFGRFGPYVQLGKIEDMEGETDKEKKKNLRTGSIPKDISLDEVTLEQAQKILEFPKVIGQVDGKDVTVLQGPYGPYMKWNGSNVSLPEGASILEFDIEAAKPVLKEAKENIKKAKTPIAELGKDPKSGGEIQVKDGRFGPYITDGKTNVSIRKGTDPKDIDFDTAVQMLEEKRKKGPGRWGRKKK